MIVSRLLTAVLLGSALMSVTTQPAVAAPVELRVVTANVGDHHGGLVREDWAIIDGRADVVFIQEARHATFRNFVDTSRWKVYQNTASGDHQGSAVLIRKDAVRSFGATVESPSLVGAAPCGIAHRYFAVATATLHNGAQVKFTSLHMPPKRCWGPVYEDARSRVIAHANSTTERLLVMGSDWNKKVADDSPRISSPTGLKAAGSPVPQGEHGTVIDGFYFSPRITRSDLQFLPTVHSDHLPVQMRVRVPAP